MVDDGRRMLRRLSEMPGFTLPPEIQEVFANTSDVVICALDGPIVARMATGLFHELDSLDANVGLLLWIDSGGGDILPASQISALIGRFSSRTVAGLVTGICHSAAMDIYLTVSKERRFALPGTWFMFHHHSSKFCIEGPFDSIRQTVAGMTCDEMCQKLKLWFDECAEVERGRMEDLEPYLKQLTEVDSTILLQLDHRFSVGTAKKIGVVGEIVQLNAKSPE